MVFKDWRQTVISNDIICLVQKVMQEELRVVIQVGNNSFEVTLKYSNADDIENDYREASRIIEYFSKHIPDLVNTSTRPLNDTLFNIEERG